ncbi:MAG: uracil-DNA glycosylase [Candidatus Kapaibacteriota bacterium]
MNRCTKCELSKTRTKFVFGSGNPDADIMFIGEAPGADEDLQGLPFVGRAGQLLTKLLREVGIERKDVFICNILKCRPPNNRKPLPSEIEMCKPYLLKQIEILNPKVIVALGATAIEGLFNIKKKMSELRGSIIYLNKIPVIVTYHPAAILRNPNLQREVIEDFNLLLNKFPSIVKRIKK